MKAPTDPSEPLFPVRPNESVCQYYMKHGTCKFGQACKFHHPPQSQLPSSAINGNTVLMGVGRKNDTPQMLWNSSGGDSNMQLLPQRPDEPNCIFFLKNGRCKYGSTCRYHHPLNYHDRRASGDVGHRQQQIQVQQIPSDSMSNIHYVTSLPPGAYQQGHFVVADGTVAFVSIDGSSPAQVISVPQGSSLNRPLGLSREVASTSSSASIASSYETASSNMDTMGTHNDSSSSLWNRGPKRSASGNSLNAYNNLSETNAHGRTQHVVHGNQRTIYVQNANDPNLNLPRVASTGNASEGDAMYYDTNTGRPIAAHSHSSSNGASWRGRRANSFDQTGPSHSSRQYAQDEDFHEFARERDDEALQGFQREDQRSPMTRGRPPPSSRPQRRGQQKVEVDDGLSMMTSALLTMLDTPEDSQAEHYQGYTYDEQRGLAPKMSTDSQAEHYQGYGYDEQRGFAPQMSTSQQMRPQYPPTKERQGSPNSPGDARHYHPGPQYTQVGPYYDQNTVDDRVLGLMMPGPQNRMDPPYHPEELPPKRHGKMPEDMQGWLPSWQGHAHPGRSYEENARSMSAVRSQPSSNSPHSPSNVGLYLP
jgi:hypothetical protein